MWPLSVRSNRGTAGWGNLWNRSVIDFKVAFNINYCHVQRTLSIRGIDSLDSSSAEIKLPGKLDGDAIHRYREPFVIFGEKDQTYLRSIGKLLERERLLRLKPQPLLIRSIDINLFRLDYQMDKTQDTRRLNAICMKLIEIFMINVSRET